MAEVMSANAIDSAQNLAGKSIFLEMGARLGVIELLMQDEPFQAEQVVHISGANRHFVVSYLETLCKLGLATPVANRDVVKGQYARGFNGYDYSTLQKDKSWQPDETAAVPIVMKAGQFVIFRSMLMHSSLPNSTSDQTRLGYVARYVPGRVKVYPNIHYVREFGGEYSLDRFGVMQVAGTKTDSQNRVAVRSLSGLDLKTLATY